MAWVGQSGSAEGAPAPPGPGQLGSPALGLQNRGDAAARGQGPGLQDPSGPALSALGLVPSPLCLGWVPDASERRLHRPGLAPPAPSSWPWAGDFTGPFWPTRMGWFGGPLRCFGTAGARRTATARQTGPLLSTRPPDHCFQTAGFAQQGSAEWGLDQHRAASGTQDLLGGKQGPPTMSPDPRMLWGESGAQASFHLSLREPTLPQRPLHRTDSRVLPPPRPWGVESPKAVGAPHPAPELPVPILSPREGWESPGEVGGG